MFQRRDLTGELAAVRDANAPEALVFDCESDFETLAPSQAEQLGLVVDALEPASYPAAWLPEDAPELLASYAGEEFTIGLPGDGSVAWTRQTTPPVVLVKPRVEGSPDSFVDFLIAEALVRAGSDVPETFLPYFGERYRELAAVGTERGLDPAGVYQLANALYEGWVGLETRDTFAGWLEERPGLGAAWQDAGTRLEGRVSGLPTAVARGETSFPEAAELACSALKHAIEVPPPFDALDATVYRDRGAEYAVAWAERTLDSLQVE
jgi:hypothetical protein